MMHCTQHYDNTPMQYTVIITAVKNEKLSFFSYFCVYTQFMFYSKNKKIMQTPVNPNFTK